MNIKETGGLCRKSAEPFGTLKKKRKKVRPKARISLQCVKNCDRIEVSFYENPLRNAGRDKHSKRRN